METKSIISGFSVFLPFAENSAQLISNLKQGKRVALSPWFKSDDEAMKCGFNRNKFVAKLEHVNDSAFDLLYRLIDNTLQQAMLDKHCLEGERVRVYLTGIGPRVDGIDYKSFYDENDIEDVAVTSSIKNLCVANMSQDNVATNLAQKYNLKYLPPNMNCTSNSALTAVHLSSQAIERGGIELALIINISKIKSQDIWFLSTQSMLETEVVQPFGVDSKGVTFAEGYSVMLLESDRSRQSRKMSGGVCLRTAYTQISASRSYDASWQSANMLKLINKIMKEADVKVDEICAVIPHGNGSAVSDSIEAKAISLLAGEEILPVLAYKGQMGYTATGSGLVDLIIGHYSLICGELIPSVENDRIIDEISPHLLTGENIVKHDKKHLLKIGLGVDGSVIAVVLTDTSKKQ